MGIVSAFSRTSTCSSGQNLLAEIPKPMVSYNDCINFITASGKTYLFRGEMRANTTFNNHNTAAGKGYSFFFTMLKTRAMTGGKDIMKTGVPTDSEELTPVDTVTNTLSLLEKQGIKQVKWLK